MVGGGGGKLDGWSQIERSSRRGGGSSFGGGGGRRAPPFHEHWHKSTCRLLCSLVAPLFVFARPTRLCRRPAMERATTLSN